MSDPNPTPAEPTTPEPGAQGDPAADKPLGENGEKALKAERDRAKGLEKANADLQRQLDAINQANESALEKAQREAKQAQELANAASAEALRFRIAAETGITENVDLILTASDEEAMRKQAALWGERTSTAPAGPRPDLSQGGSGTPASGSPEQDFAAFLGRQMAG